MENEQPTQQLEESQTLPSQSRQPEPDLKELTDLDESRLYAAMCYVAVLVFVPLLTKKDDPFINFHIRQGLVILAGIVLAVIAAAWNGTIGSVLFLILLVADVVALVMALQGRKWKIPFIGNLAEKFSI